MLNPQLLEEWKNEVKEKGHVNCPNDVSQGGWAGVGTLGLRTEGPGVAFGGSPPRGPCRVLRRSPTGREALTSALAAQPAHTPGQG